MKALTIYQPWATLVAIGRKAIETRAWQTDYRGLIAIHAGESRAHLSLIGHAAFAAALIPNGIRSAGDLPLGAVVAIARLANCVPVEACLASMEERAFGDYSHGRFAWILRDVRAVDPPIPARGYPLLWDWHRDVWSATLFAV